MSIFNSAKSFVKNHTPEVVAITAIAAFAGAALLIANKHSNCIEITDTLADELTNGDYVRFVKRGTEYVIAQYRVTI